MLLLWGERERGGAMLSYTLENVLILTVFQLLVSGLILCSSSAVLYLEKNPFVRRILKLIIAAFCLYSLHFFLRAALSYRGLSLSSPSALPTRFDFFIETFEKAALVFLGFSYLLDPLRQKPRTYLWAITGAVFLVLAVGPQAIEAVWPMLSSRIVLSSLFNGLWLAGVGAIHLRRKGHKGALAALAILVLAAAQFVRTVPRGNTDSTGMWISANAAVLLGMGLFAMVVESRSRNLPVRFFLRLNLIFIAVASILILIVAEMERREYLRIAENHTEELSEFLRGHVIYYHNQGLEPRQILSSPAIVRKVTSDFGGLTDLRRVRINFQGWTLELSIGDDWVVTQNIYPAVPRAVHARSLDDRVRMATLTPVPIQFQGQRVGSIELDESLRTINAQVASHMRIIFLTFTVGVFVAAGLFGFAVQNAQKTIQGQFEELQKTNAQLAHAARLASVGELAGGLAHEINNPAGIILATSDYLLQEFQRKGLAKGFREDLQAIRRQSVRISDIVSGLLTFSRPTILHKQPTDVNTVLRQSLNLLQPRFRNERVHVEQSLAPGISPIHADPGRLEQVFVNLLNNAADAMPDGGRVSLDTKMFNAGKSLGVVISIRDTGSGIAEENLKNIFDPFFSTKAKGKGTGLGLSVSHGIIRDHGGQIEVESRIGQGTTFRIYLPEGEQDRETV